MNKKSQSTKKKNTAKSTQKTTPLNAPEVISVNDQRPLLKRIVDMPLFGKVYIISCLVTLIATTIFWASLGAKVQQSNADQLVNFYLLDHVRHFHSATLP